MARLPDAPIHPDPPTKPTKPPRAHPMKMPRLGPRPSDRMSPAEVDRMRHQFATAQPSYLIELARGIVATAGHPAPRLLLDELARRLEGATMTDPADAPKVPGLDGLVALLLEIDDAEFCILAGRFADELEGSASRGCPQLGVMFRDVARRFAPAQA